MIASLRTSASAEESTKKTWKDVKADFEYKDRPNPSMDIREFSIEGVDSKTLEFSVLMDAPIITKHKEREENKRDTLSIFLYLDMDQNVKTGTRLSNIGHDNTIQMYLSRYKDDEWHADLDNVRKPYSEERFDLKGVTIKDNRITYRIKTKNFSSLRFNSFNLVLFTHSDRNSWIDHLPNKGSLTYAEADSED